MTIPKPKPRSSIGVKIPLAIVFVVSAAIAALAYLSLPDPVGEGSAATNADTESWSDIPPKIDAISVSTVPVRYPLLPGDFRKRQDGLRRNLADIEDIASRLGDHTSTPGEYAELIADLDAFDRAVRQHVETLAQLSLKADLARDQAGLTKGIVQEAIDRVKSARAGIRTELSATGSDAPTAERARGLAKTLADTDEVLQSLADILSAFEAMTLVGSRSRLEAVRARVSTALGALVRVSATSVSTERRFVMTSVVPRIVGSLNDPDRSFAQAAAAMALADKAGAQSARISGMAGTLVATIGHMQARAMSLRADTRQEAIDRASVKQRTLLYAIMALAGICMLVVVGVYRRGLGAGVSGTDFRRQLREVLDAVPQAFIVWDAAGDLVYVNKRYAELRPELVPLLSANPNLSDYVESVLARDNPEATPEEIAEQRIEALARSVKEELHVSEDTWFERSIKRTDAGWTVFVLDDISDRKRINLQLADARDEAERNRLWLEESFETIPDGVVFWGADGKLVYANKALGALRPDLAVALEQGSEIEEFSRREVRGRLPGATDVEIEAQAKATGEALEYQLPNGRWHQRVLREVSDVGRVLVLTDISDARLTERLLIDSLEALPAGFVLWDETGQLVHANRRYREIHPEMSLRLDQGMDIREFERHAQASGAPGSAERASEHLSSSDSNRDETVEYQTRSGHWIKRSTAKMSNGACVFNYTDITDVKNAQAALQAPAENPRWNSERE